MIDVVHNNRNLETTTGTRVTDMECGPENKTRIPHAPNLMSTGREQLGWLWVTLNCMENQLSAYH